MPAQIKTRTREAQDEALRGPEWPLISADSHGGGAPDSWYLERTPKHLRDQLPSRGTVTMKSSEGTDKEYDVDAETGRRRRPRADTDVNKVDPPDNPEERIPYLAVDGVGAEVIYSSGLLADKKVTTEAAVSQSQVGNDYLYVRYKDSFDRFAPAAALPIFYDIDEAIKELQRVAKLGLRPVVLPQFIDHKPWNRPDYDRFWAEVNDLEMPVSFHVGSGRDPRPYSNPGGALVNYLIVTSNTMETLSALTCAGVLDRYPKVNVAFVECDIGWLAWCMEFLDRAYLKHQHWVYPKLSMMPSDFVKRQVKLTFQEDPIGVRNLDVTSFDCAMWGSDFPHNEGTWPHSTDVVAETFVHHSMEDMRKVTHDNAAKLYGFKAEAFLQMDE